MLHRDDPAFHELRVELSNAVFSRYVENPNPVYSPLYMKAGKGQVGVIFESLSREGRAELLRELVDWGHYLSQGASDRQLHAIFNNVMGGKGPHGWFDGVFDRTVEQKAFRDILHGDHPKQQEVRTQERSGREI